MAFIETPRFPDDISRGAVGGPAFQTTIAVVDSGAEFRNQSWTQARRKYDVAHAARHKAQFDILLAFFLAMGGRTNGFRYKDWLDFTATGSQGIFTLVSSGLYQMVKRYTVGASTYDRTITKPISSTLAITGGVVASVNSATGVVTMTSGTPTLWTGEFDVPVRFDTDVCNAELIGGSIADRIVGWSSIPLVEIKV
jgi:uncharacterized protein (TIGR02217 family)